MNREEAWRSAKGYLYDALDGKEADEIIKALEREPCDDTISRQAVLDATVKRNSIWNKITNSKGENLEEIILQLPSVNPQPKIWHWIESRCDMYECSECDHIYTDLSGERYGMNYCPSCGAKMVEPQESEEKCE